MDIKRYKSIFSLVIFLITWIIIDNDIYAQDIRFRNIDNSNGLSQSTAEVIMQDSEGYIWIGTGDGLNKYNGYEFEIYRHDQLLENSIANNYIVSLAEDDNRNLWIGTANGLSKMNLDTEVITNYYDDKGNLSHNNIAEILFTKEGVTLVATSDGVNVYDEKSDSFERILDNEGDLSSQYILSMQIDDNDNLWIGTESGLNKVNIKDKDMNDLLESDLKVDNSFISDSDVYILEESDEYIWAGTLEQGLYRIDIDTNEMKSYTNDDKNDNSLPSNSIRDLYVDKSSHLWVGTDSGLAKLNVDDTFSVYKKRTNDYNSIISDVIHSISQDKSGLIWVGTYSGISVFNPENKIKHYIKDEKDDNSISENVVHGIYEDEEGYIWIGTKSSGVNILDENNNIITRLNSNNTNNMIGNNSINYITGKESKIYIGTKDGLFIIDKDSREITSYKEKEGLSDSDIKSLLVDSKDYLWVGTSKGIDIINTENDEIISLEQSLKDNDLDEIFTKAIYEDSEGIYWVGCFIDNGLIKINPMDNTIKRYKNDKSDKYSISSDTVRTITEDNKGNILIGTSYGLNILDKKTEKFKSYTTKNGLSNNIIYGVLVDDEENLWLSTNLGISRFNTKDEIFQNFNITDGLQGNEFNGNAAFKTKENELIFGGINGVNIFKPEDVVDSGYVPCVMFDYFEVNGKKYTDINNMKFKHNENFININLFLPDYRNSRNITYYYKIKGDDDKWREVNNNSISYSDLDPDKYTLSIVARNHNGIMTDKNEVTFIIKPPIYKSVIAKVLYAFILGIIIYNIINKVNYLEKVVRIRTKELNQQMQKNKELYEKVIDLERSKNNYFINLSHELRTPLNVIYSTEQLINETNKSNDGIDKEKLNQYMEFIQRNTKRLLTLINNIIDTSKIENGSYRLNLEEHNIVYVVEEAALSLKRYAEEKNINLIIDPEIEEKMILCDNVEIERCIVNLVSNAVKFTNPNGTIIVNIKEEGKNVIIEVEDDGVGIDKKHHKSIFNRFNQVVDPDSEIKNGSGLGLTITSQIIKLHGGQIYLESEVNKGTKFTIIL